MPRRPRTPHRSAEALAVGTRGEPQSNSHNTPSAQLPQIGQHQPTQLRRPGHLPVGTGAVVSTSTRSQRSHSRSPRDVGSDRSASMSPPPALRSGRAGLSASPPPHSPSPSPSPTLSPAPAATTQTAAELVRLAHQLQQQERDQRQNAAAASGTLEAAGPGEEGFSHNHGDNALNEAQEANLAAARRHAALKAEQDHAQARLQAVVQFVEQTRMQREVRACVRQPPNTQPIHQSHEPTNSHSLPLHRPSPC